MVESKIIDGHSWSIGWANSDPSKCGEDTALMSDLPVDIQKKVSDWIYGKLWKRESPNYQLKHQIENERGMQVIFGILVGQN